MSREGLQMPYPSTVCKQCDKHTLFVYCERCKNSTRTHNIQNPKCEYCAAGNKCSECDERAYGMCLCCANIICSKHSNLVVNQSYDKNLLEYYKIRGFTFHVACDNCISFRVPLHGTTENPAEIATNTVVNYNDKQSTFIRLLIIRYLNQMKMYDRNFINVILRNIIVFMHIMPY